MDMNVIITVILKSKQKTSFIYFIFIFQTTELIFDVIFKAVSAAVNSKDYQE